MKRKLSYLIFVVISALCIAGLFACSGCVGSRSYYEVFDDGVLEYGGYRDETYDGEIYYGDFTVIGVIGEPAEIAIPEIASGANITAISSEAFKNLKSLESVTIPASINKIANGVFEGCDNLTSIEIDEGNPVYSSRGNCIIEINTATVIAGCRTSVIVDGVKNIGRFAFAECIGLEEINLPESVNTVAEKAFYNCTALKRADASAVREIQTNSFGNCAALESIEVSSLQKIGENAFLNCSSLRSMVFPLPLTYIGAKAFYGCQSLTEITVPETVEIIENSAFADCKGIKTATLLNSKAKIGEGIFGGCAGLESMTFPFPEKYPEPDINEKVKSFGYFFGKEKYEGGTVTAQAENFQDFLDRRYTYYCVPDGLKSVTVTGEVIYGCAFSNCQKIEEVTVTQSVTEIRDNAFLYCLGLKSLTVENDLTQISETAFSYCNAVEYASLSAEAFKNLKSDALKYAEITCGTEIADETFKDRGSLKEVSIPESVTKIGAKAFSGCGSLKKITVPASVAEIGVFAFSGCGSLEEVVWNAERCKSEHTIFGGAGNIKSVIFGESVKEIPQYLCYGLSGIKNIVIPHGVTKIGKEAFAYCGELEKVEIPATVTAIEVDAFRDCNKLKEVCLADLSAWCGIDFEMGNNYTVYSNPLYVAERLYLSGALVTDLVIPEGVTEIKKYAFVGFEGFISVTLPKSLTSIDDRVFYGCFSIKKVCISDFAAWCAISFKTVFGTNPLAYASEALYLNGGKPSGNFVIEEGVTRIPDYTFRYGEITGVTLPESLKSIGKEAFLYCDELKEVFVSDFAAWCEIEMEGTANPMYKASNLYLNGEILSGEFTVPDGVTKIPDDTFKGSKVTKVTFPNGIKFLGEELFCFCRDLETVIIPDGVDEIKRRAFMWCYSFKSVYFGGTEDEWLAFEVSFHNNLQAKTYFYSEEQPAEADKYWHYIDGEVAVW